MTGRVVAITGGKGGVGKSTTTINLGVSLRLDGYSVVLVDADVEMPNLVEMLSLDAPTTIHDVLSGRAAPVDALVEVGEDFAVIPGDSALTSYGTIEPDRLQEVVDSLASWFDYVLLDTGAGLSYDDIIPLALADEVLLVTSPDPAAVENAKRTQSFIRRLNRQVGGVVVTKANSIFREGLDEAFDADVLAVVPDADVVSRSTAFGRPLELIAPRSEAAAAYRQLEANLTDGRLPPAGTVESDEDDESDAAEELEADASPPADEPEDEAPERPAREPPKGGLVGRLTSMFG